MSMQGDLRAVRITSTGSVYAGRARVRKLVFVTTATAGTLILRNGSVSGTILLQIDTPAAAGLHDVIVPEIGMLFQDGIHATLTNISSLTTMFTG